MDLSDADQPLPASFSVKSKGQFNRRIIAGGQTKTREYYLHATKGYRSYRK